MRVEIVAFPRLRLAGLRHDGPYEQISTTFSSLFPKATELGPPHTPDAQWIAVYAVDPESANDQLRAYATVSVADDAEIGDLEEVRIVPGTYARAVHVGPHGGLARTWKLFGIRLSDAGHHVLRDKPTFEMYANQPGGTPDSDLRTELYFPIR